MENGIYDILGVSKNATPEQIKQAYQKRFREFQHDQIQLITLREAYGILRDPMRRLKYDALQEQAKSEGYGFSYESQSRLNEDFRALMAEYLWHSYYRFNRVKHNFTKPDTLRGIFEIRAKDVWRDVVENTKYSGYGRLMGAGVGAAYGMSMGRGVPDAMAANPTAWHIGLAVASGVVVSTFGSLIVGPVQTGVSLLVNTTSKLALLGLEKIEYYQPTPIRKAIAISNATKTSSRLAFYAAAAGCGVLGYGVTRMAAVSVIRALNLG